MREIRSVLLWMFICSSTVRVLGICTPVENSGCPGVSLFDPIALPSPIYAPFPEDVAQQNNTFSNFLNVTDDGRRCAIVRNITKSADGLAYVISIDLRLDGGGCKTVLPWKVAPYYSGQTVSGEDALVSCKINSTAGEGCSLVDAGPSGGVALSFDPPIYRVPIALTNNDGQSESDVPFGYTGYFVYELLSKGACGKYGYTAFDPNAGVSSRTMGNLGISMAYPRKDECDGNTPQTNAFVSRFSPRELSERLAFLLRYPMYNVNITLSSLIPDIFGTAEVLTSNASNRKQPYGYVNMEEVLGIVDPFRCKSLNTTSNSTGGYFIGASPEEAHSCPMSRNEWDSILQDVVIPGETVDIFYGPNVTTYTQFDRDGSWIVPTNALGSLPAVCYRCSRVQGPGTSGASQVNYASRHMPISMTFGPMCAGLRATNSRASTRVAVGGFAGVLDSAVFADVDGDNVWITSSSIPVRYAEAIGPTDAHSQGWGAPGFDAGTVFNMSLIVSSGTSGSALRFDADSLRYVLCNGGGGVIMPAGFNSTSGLRLGPLVSDPDLPFSNGGPAWPNPFRLAAPANLTNCAGCTFPTLATQRGWTVIDSQLWRYGQGPNMGQYHVDQTIWERVLSLVNASQGLSGGELNIFGVWNTSENYVNVYNEAAAALRHWAQSVSLPSLGPDGIHGIGPVGWVSLACDYMRFSGRPAPIPGANLRTHGTTATPLCWMFQRQLWAQGRVRLLPNNITAASTTPTPDLDSAHRTGIFNRHAPNVWFGIWQRPALEGGAQWYAFFDDTWDITGGNILSPDDGMAKPVVTTLTLEIPVDLVEASPGPVTSFLSVSGSECAIPPPTGIFEQIFQVSGLFSTPTFGATHVRFTVSPQNCVSPAVFRTDGITLTTKPSSFSAFTTSLTAPDVNTGQQDLVIDVPYDTYVVVVEYTLRIPFFCGGADIPSDQVGFAVGMSYLQLTDPLPAPLEEILLHQTGLETCSDDPTNGTLGAFDAFDFRLVAPPDNLPLESYCLPIFVFNPLDAITPIPEGDDDRTALMPPNTSLAMMYECYTVATIHNYGYFAQCNVSGDGSGRIGNCTEIEERYYLCQEWWDLSCFPYNTEQMTFFYSLVLGITLIAAVVALIVNHFDIKAREYELYSAKDGKEWNRNMDEMQKMVIQDRFERGVLN